MKKTNYTLSIPVPCSEDWNDMRPASQGRHCAQCRKQVIDFTTLSDREIIQILQSNTGSLCGRLRASQLSRELQDAKPRPNHTWLRRAAAALMLLAAGKVEAGNPRPYESVEIVNKESRQGLNQDKMEKDSLPVDVRRDLVIRGLILDLETREPLPFAGIYLSGTNISTGSDIEGKFELTLPADSILNTVILKVQYVGYEETDISIDPRQIPPIVRIPMSEGFQMADVIIVAPRKTSIASIATTMGGISLVKRKKWWQFWKRNTP